METIPPNRVYTPNAQTSAAVEDQKATSQEKLPIGQRGVIKAYMGQGALASLLDNAVGTTDLSSCMAIVVYNKETKVGGVFHFPCNMRWEDKDGKPLLIKKGKNKEQPMENDLMKMLNAAAPTEIHIIKGLADKKSFGMFPDQIQKIELGEKKDMKYLQKIFDKYTVEKQEETPHMEVKIGVNISKDRQGTVIVTADENDNLVIMSSISFTEENRKKFIDLSNEGTITNEFPNDCFFGTKKVDTTIWRTGPYGLDRSTF